MKSRLLVPIVFAGVALASGVASANPQYWRDNGLLLEVSADPRDGRDYVQVDATHANRLELRALNNTVALRGLTVRFSDGRAITQPMQFVQPGQPMMVDLPRNCAAVTSVELDYGDPAWRRTDRTTARLQIVPHATRYAPHYEPQYTPHYSAYQSAPPHAYHRAPIVVQPAYRAPIVVQQAPRYTVRPRRSGVTLQGHIQGSFRF